MRCTFSASGRCCDLPCISSVDSNHTWFVIFPVSIQPPAQVRLPPKPCLHVCKSEFRESTLSSRTEKEAWRLLGFSFHLINPFFSLATSSLSPCCLTHSCMRSLSRCEPPETSAFLIHGTAQPAEMACASYAERISCFLHSMKGVPFQGLRRVT
jgi:hypothetical protein